MKKLNKYRVAISIIFGCAGFGLNFLDVHLINVPGLKISILLGLFFPLIIALAWGWRYGLISALTGGCQSMWWLWNGDGWGILYSVPVFTVWIVWHGWWAEKRADSPTQKWYWSMFAVEFPIRLILLVGFATAFRRLVSLNPPPWNPAITFDTVTFFWLRTVSIKQLITAYILLLAAYSVLSIGPVRRFFRLDPAPAQQETNAIIGGAFLMGLAVCVSDAIIDFLLFYDKPFWDILLFDIPSHELYIRTLIVLSFLVFGIILAGINRHRNILNAKIKHINSVLLAIRNVNQLITKEKNQTKLLKKACSLLIETRGYTNAWICLVDKNNTFSSFFSSGENSRYNCFEQQLKKNIMPLCLINTLQTDKIKIINDPQKECGDCALSKEYYGLAGMTIRLKHNNRIYGCLSVTTLKTAVKDIEEQHLFAEVAGDISFALWSIENESRRKSTEMKYSNILETTPDAIIGCDMNEKITVFNSGAEHLLVCKQQKAIGTPLSRFCPPNLFKKPGEFYNQLSQEGFISGFETECITADNRHVPVEATFSMYTDSKNNPIGLIAIIRDITHRKQIEHRLQQELDEKTILIREVHHRVKNNLQIITSLLNMQAEKIKTPEAAKELSESLNRVKAIADVHDQLYHSELLATIQMRDYINSLIRRQLFTVQSENKAVILDSDIEGIQFPMDIAIPFGLIINELVTNALKYAYDINEKQQLIITVSLETQKGNSEKNMPPTEKLIRFAFKDNGKGLPQGINPTATGSLGFTLIFALVKKLNGTFTILNDSGASYVLEFPIPKLIN